MPLPGDRAKEGEEERAGRVSKYLRRCPPLSPWSLLSCCCRDSFLWPLRQNSLSLSLPRSYCWRLENCLLKFNLENSWAALSCPSLSRRPPLRRPEPCMYVGPRHGPRPLWDLASTEGGREGNTEQLYLRRTLA